MIRLLLRSETKAPESAERLHRGSLGLVDISASTMANIGPVITAGIGAPLTIVAAAVAIALLGNTLSQFPGPSPRRAGSSRSWARVPAGRAR